MLVFWSSSRSEIYALPEFVFGEYEIGVRGILHQEECATENDFSPECDSNSNNRLSLIFFYLGNIFIGTGAAAIFTVGPSYVDDIVQPKFVPIHLGFFFMWVVLGPALGFALGAAFLSIYIDPWIETSLTPADPGWVGAWWLGFLFSGVVSWLVSIPFFMFPKLLPDSHLAKAECQKEMAQKYKRDVGSENVNVLTKLKSFPYHLKQVLLTPSWIFLTIAVSIAAFVVTGITAFIPKYFESQFYLTAFFSKHCIWSSRYRGRNAYMSLIVERHKETFML